MNGARTARGISAIHPSSFGRLTAALWLFELPRAAGPLFVLCALAALLLTFQPLGIKFHPRRPATWVGGRTRRARIMRTAHTQQIQIIINDAIGPELIALRETFASEHLALGRLNKGPPPRCSACQRRARFIQISALSAIKPIVCCAPVRDAGRGF